MLTPSNDIVAAAGPRLSPTATLLLLRLAAGAKPPTPAAVRKDLGKLLPAPPDEAAVAAAREELTAAGLAEPIDAPAPSMASPSSAAAASPSDAGTAAGVGDAAGSSATRSPRKAKPAKAPKADPAACRLTDAGRARAAALLGLDAVPAKVTWPNLVSKHLFPIAAGLPAGGKVPAGAKLTAHLVRRRHELPTGPAADNVGRALDALAFRELGFPDAADWPALRAAVLNRAFSRLRGEPVELSAKQIDKQVPVLLLDAAGTTAEAVKVATIRQWLNDVGDGDGVSGAPDRPAAPPPSSPVPVPAEAAGPSPTAGPPPADRPAVADLPAFAAAAKRAAAASPTGRFGADKVFIAHAWRQFRADHGHEAGAEAVALPAGMPSDLPTFKARLVEANRARLLTLARADLVEAMDQVDVRESQTRYLNAEFHFILIEGPQP